MSGEGRSLAGDSFHHVAVATEGVNVEIKKLEARPIVVGGQPLSRHCHANAVSASLTKRTGCGLHTGGDAVLGMPGSFAVDLTESLNIIQADCRLAQCFVFRIHRAYAR